MSEYFSFKRRPQEPIAQLLVRESLGFEEFAKALAQLKEEKEGHDPALRNFDLLDMSPPRDESDHEGRLWRQSDRYQWRHWEQPDGSEGGHRAPGREDGYAGVPRSDPGEASPPRAQAPVKGPDSPVGRTIPAATVGVTGISDLGFTQRAQVVGDSSPLGPQDSFIAQVL